MIKTLTLKNFPKYRQYLTNSCLAACGLMVLHYFEPENYPLTSEKEKEIFENIKFKNDELFGCCYTKLAYFLLEKGYKVKLYLGGIPYNETFIGEKYGKALHEWIYYLNLCLNKKRFQIFLDPEIYNSLEKIILEHLSNNTPIIVYLHRRWHNVVMCGIDNIHIYYSDPLFEEIKRTDIKDFKKLMLSPWKFNFLVVEK